MILACKNWRYVGIGFAFLCLTLLPQSSQAHTQLISPNGGELLIGQQLFPMEWIVSVEHPLDHWDLWYSVDSDQGPWLDIARNIPAGDPTQGSQHFFDWTVPNIAASQAWVRVRMVTPDVDYYDVSDGPFSIQSVVTCDFSGNGACGLEDLNALLDQGPIAPGVTVVSGVNDQFDLDRNGRLDLADRDRWLQLAAIDQGLATPYQPGDTNLDGGVDGVDFNAWNASKFTSTLHWDRGNFTGDAVVDGADFNVWNAFKFQASSAIVAVPESGACCFFVAMLYASWRSRR